MGFLLDQQHFGIVKLSGFVFCFVAIALIQYFAPYRKMKGQIFRNWKQNLPLAGGQHRLRLSLIWAMASVVTASFWSARISF